MNFSAVILAGGRSCRMGRDKAWLPFGNRSLLERQIDLARDLAADEVFISGRSGVEYPLGCPVLLDLWPGAGPLGGIERGLALANQPLVFVIAVDMPHLSLDLLRTLLAECTQDTGIVPICGESLEPLVAFYPKNAHGLVRSRLRKQQLAVHAFAKECRGHQLVRFRHFEAQSRDFTNWNYPRDISA